MNNKKQIKLTLEPNIDGVIRALTVLTGDTITKTINDLLKIGIEIKLNNMVDDKMHSYLLEKLNNM